MGVAVKKGAFKLLIVKCKFSNIKYFVIKFEVLTTYCEM